MGPASLEQGATEGYQHSVTIEHDFALGIYNVTRAEYASFVAEARWPTSTGCYVWSDRVHQWTEGKHASWRTPGFDQTDRDPVVCVSLRDAEAFTRWLNERVAVSAKRAEGIDGGPYHILREEEWEYAGRAGSTTQYYWGDQIDRGRGNFGADQCNPCRAASVGADRWNHTSPVGSFPSNRFGLFDMAGNVWQWTESCFNDARPPLFNTSGQCKLGFMRNNDDLAVTRGGSWLDPPMYLRSATRSAADQENRNTALGFRVARKLD